VQTVEPVGPVQDPSSSPFDDDPSLPTVEPAPAPVAPVEAGSNDPCGHVPAENVNELETCRRVSVQPAPPKPVPPPRPLDDEQAPRSQSRYERVDDYDRGVELESRGRGLLIGGIVSAVGGIVLLVSGALVQNADNERLVDQAGNDPLTEPTVTSSGPRLRGTVMMAFGGVLLVPLAHGLIIPGSFMLVRGRNLQRRAELTLSSVKFRF
jgi:hypothetical protein